MKKLPKEKRDRILLVALGTLAVLAAIWYGLVSTQQAAIKNIAKSTSEQADKVGNARRLVQSGDAIEQNLQRVARRLKAIETDMASGDKYSWVIQTINNFLVKYEYRDKHLVEIPQFSREVPTEIGMFPQFPYGAVAFTIRGTAYFHDFGKFVADFENAFPFLRVQNIDLDPVVISGANVGTDPEKLAFKMEIVALVNPGR